MSSRTKNSKSKHIHTGNNFKLIVVGDSGVGKSCFLSRYSKSTFSESFRTTIGVDYAVCNANVDGSKVTLQVWDTAGQERFRAITMAYYRQSQGIFLVYDCCDMTSLENVKNIWMPDIRRYCNGDAKIVLLGNKVDNIDFARAKGIDTELIRAEAKAFAEQEGMRFFETSARHNTNIDAAFHSIAKELKKQALSRPETTQTGQSGFYQSGFHIDYMTPPRSVIGKICYFFSTRSKRRHARRQYR